MFDLVPPAHRERYTVPFEGELDRYTATDRFDDGTPLLLRQADGTDVPVEISVSEVELGDRTLAHSILRNISDRREREQDRRLKGRAVEAASVGVTVKTVVEAGSPARVITEYAARVQADLTVMSTHARSGAGRFLFGSITEQVIQDSDAPVLAVQRQ